MQGYIGADRPPPGWRLTLLRHSVAVVCVAISLLLVLWLRPLVDPEAPLLVAVLIAAWFGGLWPALLASLAATLAVDYYFSPPIDRFAIDVAHVPRLVTFALLAAGVAVLTAAQRRAGHSLKMARDEMEGSVQERTAELRQTNEQLHAEIVERRRTAEALRERASLVDLTHDSVFVRGMDDVITLWNRGAEEQYGWTQEEARGRTTHDLLKTVFPAPLNEITRAMIRTGRWEGELVHTRRDGTQIVTASRWALQLDPQGNPLAVLETNRDITERKRAAQALEDLAGRLINAQEEERSRIGRELHDHISQTLGVLTIKIDQLRADGAIAPGVAAALEELRHDTSEITDDVHRLSHRLHSSTLDYLGLVPALQKLVADFSERHGISTTFTHASLTPSLPSDVALCLFRIAEESLTNIAKHSQARSAHVDVTGAPDGIRLRVEDTGAGFDVTSLGSKAGLGFVSMQERLRALRGTVLVDSAPSQGTRIDVWVPSTSHLVSAPAEVEQAGGGQR